MARKLQESERLEGQQRYVPMAPAMVGSDTEALPRSFAATEDTHTAYAR